MFGNFHGFAPHLLMQMYDFCMADSRDCVVNALQRKSHYEFLFWELLGLSLNFQINVSVSDIYRVRGVLTPVF